MAEYLQAEKKQEIFAKYGKSNTDTGSPESQVALFSYRIAHLTKRRISRDTEISSRSWVSVDKQILEPGYPRLHASKKRGKGCPWGSQPLFFK